MWAFIGGLLIVVSLALAVLLWVDWEHARDRRWYPGDDDGSE